MKEAKSKITGLLFIMVLSCIIIIVWWFDPMVTNITIMLDMVIVMIFVIDYLMNVKCGIEMMNGVIGFMIMCVITVYVGSIIIPDYENVIIGIMIIFTLYVMKLIIEKENNRCWRK